MDTERINKSMRERYNVENFCFAYTISRTEFYREVKAKRLRTVKRGRRTYVTRSDAEAWLNGQTNEGGNAPPSP